MKKKEESFFKLITQKPWEASQAILDNEHEGKNYAWCSCGLSKNQPFCDNSHKGSEFKPVIYKATETKKMFFCACKQTNNQPLCDGSHNKK